MAHTYDEKRLRVTINGNISSKIADAAIVYNLKHTFKQVRHLSHEQILDEYDTFSLSDMFGNNDENFMEWLTSRDMDVIKD